MTIDKLIPEAVRVMLGEPPLISGEDVGAYEMLLGQLGVESGAASIVDWIHVSDVAALTWQIFRMRRWLSVILENGQKEGLAAGLEKLLSSREKISAARLADASYSDLTADEDGRDGEGRLNALLAPYGVEQDDIANANSFFQQFKLVADAEELLSKLEHRRDCALRQIEARRTTLGAALRSSVEGRIEEPKSVPALTTHHPRFAIVRDARPRRKVHSESIRKSKEKPGRGRARA
jgi:hypothetical protein